MRRDGLPTARRIRNRRRVRTITCVIVVSCFLLALFNPLRWWFPRRGGERSPGTTTGWVDDAGSRPGELSPASCRRQLV